MEFSISILVNHDDTFQRGAVEALPTLRRRLLRPEDLRCPVMWFSRDPKLLKDAIRAFVTTDSLQTKDLGASVLPTWNVTLLFFDLFVTFQPLKFLLSQLPILVSFALCSLFLLSSYGKA